MRPSARLLDYYRSKGMLADTDRSSTFMCGRHVRIAYAEKKTVGVKGKTK
jgi:hypothetical protein